MCINSSESSRWKVCWDTQACELDVPPCELRKVAGRRAHRAGDISLYLCFQGMLMEGPAGPEGPTVSSSVSYSILNNYE